MFPVLVILKGTERGVAENKSSPRSTEPRFSTATQTSLTKNSTVKAGSGIIGAETRQTADVSTGVKQEETTSEDSTQDVITLGMSKRHLLCYGAVPGFDVFPEFFEMYFCDRVSSVNLHEKVHTLKS